MKNTTKEQEYGLIKSYLELEEQYQTADNNIENKIKDELETSILEISRQLNEIDFAEASIEILDNLKYAFKQMKNKVFTVKDSLPISKSQGSVIYFYKDIVLTNILTTIKSIVNNELYGNAIPSFNTTEDPEDSFDRNILISFLDNEINELNQIGKVNYIVLKNYYDGFARRLLKQVEQ